MGHYAVLISGNDALPYQETEPELCLEVKYTVPIFWFALFGVSDIRGGAHSSVNGEPWPYLVAPRETALRRLRDRKDLMFKVLPEVHLPIFEMFYALLDGLKQPYLHCDISDVASMNSDPSECRVMLGEIFEALDQAPRRKMRTGFAGLLFGWGLPRGWWHLLIMTELDLLTPKSSDVGSLAGNFEEMPWERISTMRWY
jgi:hypothetical protein